MMSDNPVRADRGPGIGLRRQLPVLSGGPRVIAVEPNVRMHEGLTRNAAESVVRGAGFRDVRIDPLHVKTVFVPLRCQIAAVCTA